MWDHTLNSFASSFKSRAIIRKMDYRKNGKWVKDNNYLESDLFIFSYTLSEAWRYNSDGSVSGFLDHVISASKPGAMFLYSDNSGQQFDPHFTREFLERKDLRLVHRESYDHVIVGSDEQTSDLEPYVEKFARKPKLRGKATCAAMVKI